MGAPREDDGRLFAHDCSSVKHSEAPPMTRDRQAVKPLLEARDQIFELDLDTAETSLVSTGTGRTTCAYYMPDNASILYASTHLGSTDCPPKPDYTQGYVWPIYDTFDIFVRRPDGSLDQLLLAPQPLYFAVLVLLSVYWLVSGALLALLSPLFALMLSLPPAGGLIMVTTPSSR